MLCRRVPDRVWALCGIQAVCSSHCRAKIGSIPGGTVWGSLYVDPAVVEANLITYDILSIAHLCHGRYPWSIEFIVVDNVAGRFALGVTSIF